MSKWIAEFDLEDGDTMPEHMDLNYMGAKIDFHCRPMWIPVSERLPEKDKDKDFYKCLVAVRCTSRHNICDTITAYFDGEHFYSHLYDKAIISGIKAWALLPEPYKAESAGQEIIREEAVNRRPAPNQIYDWDKDGFLKMINPFYYFAS